jgi:hypothetical protein
MSEEDVEVWRAHIEALRAGASGQFDQESVISKMAEVWDPRIEQDVSEAPAGLGVSGVYRGIDAGDRAVMLLDLRMRGRSSGIEVALGKHAWVATFRDGLMVKSKLYMSQADALEAAGLRE